MKYILIILLLYGCTNACNVPVKLGEEVVFNYAVFTRMLSTMDCSKCVLSKYTVKNGTYNVSKDSGVESWEFTCTCKTKDLKFSVTDCSVFSRKADQ